MASKFSTNLAILLIEGRVAEFLLMTGYWHSQEHFLVKAKITLGFHLKNLLD